MSLQKRDRTFRGRVWLEWHEAPSQEGGGCLKTGEGRTCPPHPLLSGMKVALPHFDLSPGDTLKPLASSKIKLCYFKLLTRVICYCSKRKWDNFKMTVFYFKSMHSACVALGPFTHTQLSLNPHESWMNQDKPYWYLHHTYKMCEAVRMSGHQKKTKAILSRMWTKGNPTYTAGGHVNWSSHHGGQHWSVQTKTNNKWQWQQQQNKIKNTWPTPGHLPKGLQLNLS